MKGIQDLEQFTRFNVPGLVKVSVVKDQKELVVVFQSVDRVGNTLGEVPDVTVFELNVLVAALLIDGADQNASSIHETPFSLVTESVMCHYKVKQIIVFMNW